MPCCCVLWWYEGRKEEEDRRVQSEDAAVAVDEREKAGRMKVVAEWFIVELWDETWIGDFT